MAMTRREYAASLGLAEMGKRGRMSQKAHDAIAKAERDGVVFAEPVATAPKPKPKPKAPPTFKAKINPESKITEARVDQHADTNRIAERLPEPFTGRFEVTMPNGKVRAVSERTACVCGASLAYCPERTPRVGLLILDPLARVPGAAGEWLEIRRV